MNKFFAALKKSLLGIPRPEPTEVNSEKICAIVTMKNNGDYLVKYFTGSPEGEWIFLSLFNMWKPQYTSATERYEGWKKSLVKEGFVTIGDKDYPISDIKDIELTKEENWITIK